VRDAERDLGRHLSDGARDGRDADVAQQRDGAIARDDDYRIRAVGKLRVVDVAAVQSGSRSRSSAATNAELRAQPHRVLVQPGSRHWGIFERLCRESRARGNLVADAYLAALAIESGCEWVTTEPRLQPLRRPPLAPSARLRLR
jgi:hypothetical protein